MSSGVRISLFLVLLSLLAAASGCGYHLTGTGRNIPENLNTVYIAEFDNKTSLAQASEFVTTAIRREFTRRSGLVLTEDVSRADATLEGEIAFFDVKPQSYSATATASQYTVTIRVNVRFIDLKDNAMIYEGKMLSFSDQYDLETDDFFSQEARSLERISREFASSVVSLILENF